MKEAPWVIGIALVALIVVTATTAGFVTAMVVAFIGLGFLVVALLGEAMAMIRKTPQLALQPAVMLVAGPDLIRARAAIEVRSTSEAVEAIGHLARDDGLREEMGGCARAYVDRGRGAAEAGAALVSRMLKGRVRPAAE